VAGVRVASELETRDEATEQAEERQRKSAEKGAQLVRVNE
jgi:hypothetical protein